MQAGPSASETADDDRQAGSTPMDVVHRAGEEARGVAEEGKAQVRGLADEARQAVRGRVSERSDQLAQGLSELAGDLEAMAGAPEGDGPLPRVVHQLATITRGTAERLERDGAEGILEDVRNFARRRPGVFLGVAFGVGLIAGRLLRSDIEEHRDPSAPEQRDGASATTPAYGGLAPGADASGGADIDLRRGEEAQLPPAQGLAGAVAADAPYREVPR
jgi:hypothetical protein